MSFLDSAKRRYSVRSYKTQRVEKDKIDVILEAAHVAPTAANLQPIRLLLVQEEEGLKKIGKAANIYQAPAAIIVLANHDRAWIRPYDHKQTCDIDATILTDHMMLQAQELGLGSLWVCHFKPDVLAKEFNLPQYLEPINILALGYPDGEPQSPERHKDTRISISELVYYESF